MDKLTKLSNIATKLNNDAKKCATYKSYFAASLLATSSLEAILIGMCYCFSEKAKLSKIYKYHGDKKGFKRKNDRFTELTLYELIKIADELSWIPSEDIKINHKKTVKFNELLYYVRDMRNLIHPGKMVIEMPKYNFNKQDFDRIYEIIEVTREILYKKLIDSISLKIE